MPKTSALAIKASSSATGQACHAAIRKMPNAITSQRIGSNAMKNKYKIIVPFIYDSEIGTLLDLFVIQTENPVAEDEAENFSVVFSLAEFGAS